MLEVHNDFKKEKLLILTTDHINTLNEVSKILQSSIADIRFESFHNEELYNFRISIAKQVC